MIIVEPREEIKFTPDYEANEPIFWSVFKDLSKNNNGLVSYDKQKCKVNEYLEIIVMCTQ
jgi:hypothetical protein